MIDKIIEVNATYIFLKDDERIKSTPENLTEIIKQSQQKYSLYESMWEETREIVDEYEIKLRKMPRYTKEEIAKTKNCMDRINFELTNQYYHEAVHQWCGMGVILSIFANRIDHWRKIQYQAKRALEQIGGESK